MRHRFAGDESAQHGRLKGRVLYSIAVVALGTGMRRGELCALGWQDVDMEGRACGSSARSSRRARAARFKAPKTKRGRRPIYLSPAVVTELRAYWKAQQERRPALGVGKAPADGLVFASWEGEARQPDGLSKEFSESMKAIGRSHVTLHTLRHTHASRLITSGMDILTVSRRLGHSSPAITLSIWNLLSPNDDAAAIMQATFANAGVER